MKKFLTHGGLLLGFVLLVNFAFYFFIRYPRKDYYDFAGKAPVGNKFMFGDSHVAAFLADVPGNAIAFYNAGYSSDNYIDIRRKADWLMERSLLKAGDTVFLQFDHHMFFHYRELSNNNDLTNYLSVHSVVDLLPVVYYKNIFSLPVLKNSVKLAFKKPDKRVKKCFSLDDTKARNYMYERAAKQYDYPEYSEKLLATFTDIVSTLRSQGVVVVLVSYPLHPAYYELLHTRFDVSLFDKTRSALRRQFPGILMLDYEKWNSEGCFFKDQDHLNVYGSIELTKLIKEDLLKAQGSDAVAKQ